MTYEFLLFELKDGVAHVTLNRPERLNALSLDLLDELQDVLSSVEKDDAARCLLISGAGRGFCSGADLAEAMAAGLSGSPTELLAEKYHPVILKMQDLGCPIVAAVNGPCAGAGMSLAMAADILIAGRSATFVQAFANIGLVPDAGATYLLPRRVGAARAAALALLGEKITAAQALEWGLLWAVVEDEKLPEEAFALASRLAAGPTRALGLCRRLLRVSDGNDLATQLGLEAKTQGIAAGTEDAVEGIRAFLEKRPARFKGR